MPETRQRALGSALTLKQWASDNQLSYRTAWRMYRDNRLPKSLQIERLPSGTIRLFPILSSEVETKGNAVIYARINPRQSRQFLETQVNACKSFCYSAGWVIDNIIREIAPAVGPKRAKLNRLLSNPPGRLVILTQSVLSRFDFNLLEQALKRSGCVVTVLDKSQELNGEGGSLEDVIDAISITCLKHYGIKRGALLIEALTRLLKNKSA